MSPAATEEMLVGEYLVRRLRQIGVDTIFGVPGDYELPLLDQIPEEHWNGSPNELVAAYSADGYARVKGYGALVTTFGPGETSALCGTAGSFCELVPVLHIVGYPGVRAQQSGKIFHHTIGDLKYDHFLKMSAEVSCAATVIKNADEAPKEIDRMLNAMIHHSQPAYIGIPVDLQTAKITTAQLNVPLVKSLQLYDNDIAVSEEVASKIGRLVKDSKHPIVISDGGATRNDVLLEVQELVNALGCPVFTTLMGKGSVNEQHPQFCGVFAGAGSYPDVIKAIEASDCVLWIGNFPSDFNTGGFSSNVSVDKTIDFQRFHVKIGREEHRGNIKAVLQKLIKTFKTESLASKYSGMPCAPYPPYMKHDSEEIKHIWLWQRFTSFLREGDFIITETGCSQAGMNEARLPKGVGMFTQAIFGSIGYASGAAVGAAIAAKELDTPYKRLILVTGDGSLQLTVQAFSILQRHGITPIIFVINNGGYTVEKLIHGLYANYNKIPAWDYCALLKAFGPDVESQSYKVAKSAEIDELLNNKQFNDARHPQLVEVMMGPLDCPDSVKVIGSTADKHNAG